MAVGLLDGLNEQQRQAVSAGDGPVLVLAGPGSGKTRVLTHRIAWLVQEKRIWPGGIMAVTFTNKAAGEMRERVEKLLGGRLMGLNIGTFHAICARLLRREAAHTRHTADYLIYDTDDQLAVITQALGELDVDAKKYRPRQMLSLISGAKNELIPPEQYRGQGYQGEVTRRVYERYQQLLVSSNARDFDDLLADTVRLLREQDSVRQQYQQHYEHLLVDEFQDTNMAQYELVKLLAQPQNNVFVVGDEDQAIYGFRGADYRNVLEFRRDFPTAQVILLEQNYRSTQIVLDAARAIIDKNRQRTPKALFTDRQGGAPVTVYEAYNETDEADYIIDRIAEQRRRGLAYGDFAVMYRTNAQSRALEEAFIRARMPYKLIGGVGFYKRREVRDLLAYLRLINNPNDTVSFNRIINVPKRGIGDKSLQTFQSWTLRQRYTLAAALDAIRQGDLPPLSAAAAKRFVEFAALMDGWRTLAQAGDLSALLDDILLKIGYNLHLLETSDTPEQGREREENVKELRALLDRSKDKPLSAFLDEIALVSDVDALQASDDAVTLLTLHSAKGLEYPVVFITGLEEGLLPHFRSFEEPDAMAEERRLMYVGLTRAMHAVYLSYAFRRMTYGESGPSAPSRFLYDIPGDLTSGMPAALASDRSMRRLLADAVWDDMPSAAADGMRPVSPGAARPYPGASAAGAGLRFKTGLRVYHARFGEGIVIESRRIGQDEEVTISFREPGVGIKTLAASFANLIVLDQ